MLLAVVGCAVLGGVALAAPQRASACTCASLTDEEAFAHADVTFTGTLIETIVADGATYSSTDPERFVFDVAAVYQGDAHARQAIVTAREGASCGLEISGPGPFVVFARSESGGLTGGAVDGEYYASLCSGTRALASAELPASFGAGASPLPGESPIGGGTGRASVGPVAVTAALVLVGAGGFLLGRRRRFRARSSPEPD